MYDYFVYKVPIQSFTVNEHFTHIDTIPFNFEELNFIIKSITINDDNSITVDYNGGVERKKMVISPSLDRNEIDYFKDELETETVVIDEFAYKDVYFTNQTILTSCMQYKNQTLIDYYKYLNHTLVDGTERLFVSHQDGQTESFMPCDYPKIIQYTKNLP